jgi:hypothetical protein
MSQALDCVRGDTFETQEDFDLFQKIVDGNHEVVASEAWDGGYGHHSVQAIVLFEGSYYSIHASGCSCDGSATVSGPFATREAAGSPDLPAGDNYSG